MNKKTMIAAVALSGGFFLAAGGMAAEMGQQKEQGKQQQSIGQQEQKQQQQAQQGQQQATPYAQQLSSPDQLSKAKVQTQQGQEIGTVEQVLMDPQEGKVAYVLVKSKGGGQQFISWDSLQVQQGQQGQQAQQAQQPGQMTLVLQGQARQLASPDQFRNAKIQTKQGQEIGTVERTFIDAQQGQIAYVLVKQKTGPQAIVPWNALQLQQARQGQQTQPGQQQQQQPGQMTLVLQSPGQGQQLKEAPQGNLPNILDREQGALIHQYYGVSPYWEGGQQQQQKQQPFGQPGQEQKQQQPGEKKTRSIMD